MLTKCTVVILLKFSSKFYLKVEVSDHEEEIQFENIHKLQVCLKNELEYF